MVSKPETESPERSSQPENARRLNRLHGSRLRLVFGGDVLDVDANSDYGAAFGRFKEDFGSAVNRRSTVIVLGDGRGNGNDPNLEAFAEITRRARETIWLTPEPRYSWGLGGCDLPDYAEYCSRVRVVRDLTGLESAAQEMAEELVGRVRMLSVHSFRK